MNAFMDGDFFCTWSLSLSFYLFVRGVSLKSKCVGEKWKMENIHHRMGSELFFSSIRIQLSNWILYIKNQMWFFINAPVIGGYTFSACFHMYFGCYDMASVIFFKFNFRRYNRALCSLIFKAVIIHSNRLWQILNPKLKMSRKTNLPLEWEKSIKIMHF